MDRKKATGLIAFVVLASAFIGFSAMMRARRSAEVARTPAKAERTMPKQSPPATPSVPVQRRASENDSPKPRPKVAPEKQGAALHDATLLTLIQNAKVAQQRGDVRTRDAMLSGLKKQPDRSKELLRREISSTPDQTVAYALQTLLEQLQ